MSIDNMENSNNNNTNTFEYWDDIEINPKLLRGIFAYGFEKPSPIQKKSILPLISGKDIIGQWKRYYRSSSIWNRKNRSILCWNISNY
jgi:translation initiation factor 4A